MPECLFSGSDFQALLKKAVQDVTKEVAAEGLYNQIKLKTQKRREKLDKPDN